MTMVLPTLALGTPAGTGGSASSVGSTVGSTAGGAASVAGADTVAAGAAPVRPAALLSSWPPPTAATMMPPQQSTRTRPPPINVGANHGLVFFGGAGAPGKPCENGCCGPYTAVGSAVFGTCPKAAEPASAVVHKG